MTIEKNKELFEGIDFAVVVSKGKKINNNEDSYFTCQDDKNALLCVCDGCGGAGGKKYAAFSGKTGAYLASRIVTGTLRDCFHEGVFMKTALDAADIIKLRVTENLLMVRQFSGNQERLKGGLTKELPTTLVAASVMEVSNQIEVRCIWAGDSRCYLLDQEGLHQLTEDDLNQIDAMDNLTADGIMTNYITLSKDYSLHCNTIQVRLPGILFAATDGCFAYYSTPMEFEYLLTSTLENSDSAVEWENAIDHELSSIAGDDFTLAGFVFGFGNYLALKEFYARRNRELEQNYINKLAEKTVNEKQSMWNEYKESYLKYLS